MAADTAARQPPAPAASPARRQRARVAHWLARTALEALHLGAGPAELGSLAAVADALRARLPAHRRP